MRRARKCSQLWELPYGVTMEVTSTFALLLQSELRGALCCQTEDVPADVALVCHAVESLLLAQAAAGVDLRGPEAAQALTTALESIAHHLD